ncbi:50S ribosomal protein L15e [Candidatus Bathyarchaeota archaeon]|nr:MAG: 50S ribosomal protein L15e [Candidatus Bathyarchaeota archaeon]
MRQFAFKWRREPAILRVEKPTRIERAKRLGYKAKQGFVVVRARIRRSGARKKRPSSGRRQKAMGVTKIKWRKSAQQIAEGRVAKKYPNMEVLNSYYLWADGKYFWTEVLLIDAHHSSVMNDPQVNWISKT